MPELPEVEVVKRSLTRKVQNLIIQKVNIKDSKLRYHLDKNKFRKIRGLRIKKIERKSKFLLFFLNKNFIMMVHLGMTGKFFFVDRKNTKLKTSFYYNIDYKKEQFKLKIDKDGVQMNINDGDKKADVKIDEKEQYKFLQESILKENRYILKSALEKKYGATSITSPAYIKFKNDFVNKNRVNL